MLRKLISGFASSPYKVLGITKEATAQDIKLAYYKLAQQYHPDKNDSKDASRQFATICQAYEVLSDEGKRKMYDTCGTDNDYEQEFREKKKEKVRKPKKQYYTKFTDDYETIFDEFDQFFQQKHGKRKPYYAKKKGDDIKMSLTLSFREALFGVTRVLNYQRLVICHVCDGSRAQTQNDSQKCYSCGGSGWLSYVDGGMHVDVKCTNCEGWGKVIRCPCSKCQGQGVFEITAEKKVELPKTITNNNTIRVQDAGNASRTGGASGDLLIEVTIQQDETLRREGNNIVSDINLTVAEMVLGCRKSIDTIWGFLDINIPAFQQPKTKLQIPQFGVQYGSASWKKGDHILVLQLKVPTDLKTEEREIYQQLQQQ